MKNRAILVLLLVGCIFSSGLLGFFIGRNTAGTVVEISSGRQETTQATTAPIQTTPTAPTTHPTETSAPTNAATETTEPSTAATEPTSPGKVNINTASLEELDALPGIGPVIAQRIINYREENGPFTTISELTMVKGIGVTTLEKLKEYITVGGDT